MSHDQVVTDLALTDDASTTGPSALERRGRWWLAVSFLFCPCHLPLTLGLLVSVTGGTALGGLLRDHGWVAAGVIVTTWLAGTARGLLWIRRAERGELTCRVPVRR
jgi:hypothetical protein